MPMVCEVSGFKNIGSRVFGSRILKHWVPGILYTWDTGERPSHYSILSSSSKHITIATVNIAGNPKGHACDTGTLVRPIV